MMGGIDTDAQGATTLAGLFAAGECACVSINGANRLGSNSLPELLVFGARAGMEAARFALEPGDMNRAALEAQAADEQQRLSRDYINKHGGLQRVSTVRNKMTLAMEAGAGIFRDAGSLTQTCQELAALRQQYQDINLDDRTLSFNTELTAALELDCMLDVALAVAHSALARTESRGSHQRTDHPDRDDSAFLKHSLAYHRPDGPPRIEYKNVTITSWPPGERTYGTESAVKAKAPKHL